MKDQSIKAGLLNRILALALGVLLVIAANDLSAADITWGTPTNVAGVSDVSSLGTLFEAVNTGSDSNSVPRTTTVNGVPFTGWAINGAGANLSPGGHFSFTAAAGYFHASFNGFGLGAAPFSNLAASYQDLLGWGNFPVSQTNPNDFTGALTLTISGLTVGGVYQFQWWTNDARPFATGTVMATGGAFSIALSPNTSNTAGGLGQFGIGTFTADATSQLITFATTGNATLINGFQLRVIPEPSNVAFVVAGLFVFGLLGRRGALSP